MNDKVLPIFGDWQAVEVLVGGAQAFAYRAVPVRGGTRQVFIKWFVGDLPEERFTREVHALRQLGGSIGLPRILRHGMRDGHPWIAMRWLEGVNLDVFARQNPDLNAARWLLIAILVTRALKTAHEVGVLHRDIKPANVMIDDEDLITLVDFGLAVIGDRHSQTNQGDFLGTYAFIAPEGLQGALTLTEKSDVFSLAATLIYLAYGGMPPAVQALGPLANEGWGEAAEGLPDAWMRNVLRESVETDPTNRPTAQKFLKRLVAVPVESVAAASEMSGEQAGQISVWMSYCAEDDDDWGRVRDWALFAHEMGNPRGVAGLGRLVESLDGVEASLPYWRHYATQSPVIGRVMLYRAIRRNPRVTPSELEGARSLLYEAGEDGGFTEGHGGLGYELLALGDHAAALRAFEPLDTEGYPAAALCRHRLGLPPTSPPKTSSFSRDVWSSAEKTCRRLGLEQDATWLKERFFELRGPVSPRR